MLLHYAQRPPIALPPDRFFVRIAQDNEISKKLFKSLRFIQTRVA